MIASRPDDEDERRQEEGPGRLAQPAQVEHRDDREDAEAQRHGGRGERREGRGERPDPAAIETATVSV